MSNCPILEDGTQAIQWINVRYNTFFQTNKQKTDIELQTLFGDCVYGWQETASLLFGYLSIFCWLNAQMP